MNSIVTITGPSCAGKSTLEKMLKAKGFEPCISATSRDMRFGEVNGVQYYFYSREAFLARVMNGDFVENVDFGGNLYGVLEEEVKRVFVQGRPVVLVVEPQGLIQVKRWSKSNDVNLFSVFVDNPQSVIADRFISRITDELAAAHTDIERTRVRNAAAKRLAIMMTDERAWQNQAWSTRSGYNLVLDQFNETNCEQIVDLIQFKVNDSYNAEKITPFAL
jgi:guanylate kinase